MLLGLGKSFLEQHTVAAAGNACRVASYLDLCAGKGPVAPAPFLEPAEAETVLAMAAAFREAATAWEQEGGPELAMERAGKITDERIRAVGELLARPRQKVPTTGIRDDLEVLRTLGGPKLTLEDIFGTTSRALLFLNSALASKPMKKAVSEHLKPIYFALRSLQKRGRSEGMTLNHVLRSPHRALTFLAGLPDNDPDAAAVRQSLDQFRQLAIPDLVAGLKKVQADDDDGAAAADAALLDNIFAFERGPLANLKLDPLQTSLLLLLLLESPITGEVKQMFEAGELARKSSRQIVAALHEKLAWQRDLLRAYNALSTAPSR